MIATALPTMAAVPVPPPFAAQEPPPAAAPETGGAPALPFVLPSLATRCMLVDLTVSEWEGKRQEQDVVREVAAAHNSDEGMGSYTKKLLPREAFARTRAAIGALEREHQTRTLPWRRGEAILLNVGYYPYVAAMTLLRQKVEEALEADLVDFQHHVNEAARLLGTLFRRSDYPSVTEMRERFKVRWVFYDVPTSGDWRVVGLADADVLGLQEQMDAAVKENVQAAMTALTERVKKAVGHVAARLREYVPAEEGGNGRLHPAMLDNAKELAELLPALNVTDDPAVARLADRIRGELCRFGTQTLKDSSAVRAKVAAAADAILAEADAIAEAMDEFI